MSSSAAGLVLPDHQVGAVAVGTASSRRRAAGLQQVVGAGLVELVAELGAEAVLELVVGLAVLGAEAPLVAEQRRLVEVGGDVVEGDALDHPAAGERRHEDRVVGLDGGGAVGQLDAAVVALLAMPARARTVDSDGTMPQSGSSLRRVAADLAEPVHDVEALEGVLAVEEPALVDVAQVALDVACG